MFRASNKHIRRPNQNQPDSRTRNQTRLSQLEYVDDKTDWWLRNIRQSDVKHKCLIPSWGNLLQEWSEGQINVSRSVKHPNNIFHRTHRLLKERHFMTSRITHRLWGVSQSAVHVVHQDQPAQTERRKHLSDLFSLPSLLPSCVFCLKQMVSWSKLQACSSGEDLSVCQQPAGPKETSVKTRKTSFAVTPVSGVDVHGCRAVRCVVRV